MAQTNYTPISLYYSTTASQAPSAGNLVNGELAINITDGKLYYKDNGGVVQIIAGKGGAGVAAGSNTQVQFNNSGSFGASSSLTWDGTTLATNKFSATGDAATSGGLRVLGSYSVNAANQTAIQNAAGVGGLYINGPSAGSGNRGSFAIWLQDSAGANYINPLSIDSSGNSTFSANPTLSGGTANGVLYLNGSKVATSGSALTFDGTNLGIGNTSPSSYNAAADNLVIGSSGNNGMTIVSGSANAGCIMFADGTTGQQAYEGQITYDHSVNQMWFNVSASEQMRLTSTGLGIGTTSPSVPLDVNKTGIQIGSTTGYVVSHFRDATPNKGIALGYDSASQTGIIIPDTNSASSNLAFWTYDAALTGWAERARIDSSGNLLVAKTAQSATTVGFEVRTTGNFTSTMSASTDATSTSEVYSTGAAAYRFYVGLGGTVYATSTTISAISDQRFKENIRDLDVGLSAVMALKPRKFDWKSGKGKDIKNDRGFIAQEFEQVFPDLIDEWKDPAPEGQAPYKSVRQDLIPVLVKAIQEQQSLITDLRTRVAQLEKGA